MIDQIIGKGTWIDKIADNILKREKKLQRNLDMLNVESGLGASGLPHIGSMGDAVRAYGISKALQNLGFKSQLIAYSDDMDGLRKIPSGFPNWLKDYLSKPVSSIPDPFGSCHNSYGSHMSSLLLDGLDKVGIIYTFKSATDVYKSGILDDVIDQILKQSQILGEHISSIVGQKKYLNILPYFPICENCGRLYVAKANIYLEDEKKVLYSCDGGKIGNHEISGCGHVGEVYVSEGKGKLAWKAEFAARWKALDIRFEAYGKDIMDSVKVNDWVCDEILNFSHPFHVKYEMFLDKKGKKISKSSGNVLTPQMWLKYGTPQSLLLLLYKRISGTRHIGIDDIPLLMDEYDYYEDLYFGRIKENNQAKLIKLKGIYEYINHLEVINTKDSLIHIPYNMLVQQASLFKEDRLEKIYNRLKKYRLVTNKSDDLFRKLTLASNWADDVISTDENEYNKINLNELERSALDLLIQNLQNIDLHTNNSNVLPDTIQGIIFEISKKTSLTPKLFFKLLYNLLINSDRGPKLGNYIADLGIERTCKILEKYL